MIDYQPNKITLTGEDAVKFAVIQMQNTASKLQNALETWTDSSASEIVKRLEEGKAGDEVDAMHKAAVALYGAVQGIEIVCGKEGK